MKIGILTLPIEHNYGCVLQLWALYTHLKNQGNDVIVLNRRWNNIGKVSSVLRLKRYLYRRFICREFISFANKNMKISKEVRSSKELYNLVKELNLEAIIVGSDQIWRIEHTRGADLNYFLDFAEGLSVRKISYAASFGTDNWLGTIVETEEIKKYLSSFNAISVRENTGIDICKNIFHVSAQHVLDPTMLLNSSEYSHLFQSEKHNSFLVAYILDNKPDITRFISKVSANENLEIINLYKGDSCVLNYMSVPRWLMLIFNAKYVIVDSFHGMIFSILFHKQFCVICNHKRGYARFKSLLLLLGLEDRLFIDESAYSYDKLKEPIDYGIIDSKLQELKEKSLDFIKNALK